MKPEVVLIAGFDSSGGAGLTVDGETVCALGAKPRFVVTAQTAQTDDSGLVVEPASAAMLQSQFEAAFSGVFPRAAKIGMLPNREIETIVAAELKGCPELPIVFDPALTSSSGLPLMEEDCLDLTRDELFPLVSLVTPNLDEAQRFTGVKCECRDDMVKAGEILLSHGVQAVLVKGGHLSGDSAADCLLVAGSDPAWLESPRVEGDFRGTGCRLSSTIAAQLAVGCDLPEAVRLAKSFLTDYLLDRAG